MTDLVTGNPPGQPDPAADLEAAMLLAEVRESVLRMVAELPTAPAWIRISARGISVELEWSPAGEQAHPQAPRAGAPITAISPTSERQTPAEGSPPLSGDHPSGGHRVLAALVGTFYRAPEPGVPPFVEVGDPVHVGGQLAIVEAMKLLVPVEADVNGRVSEVLKSDGQPVEFGEPLFLIERD